MRCRFFAICLLGLLVTAGQTLAQDLSEVSRILSVQDDSGFSRLMAETSTKGYLLSDGTPVRFAPWYAAGWRELRVTTVTELGPQLGMLWGMGTGERAEKHRIEPSLRLGFVWALPARGRGAWTVMARTVIGGRLREERCSANFGAIGGTQEVNCRLAASAVPPPETLSRLYDRAPLGESMIELRYTLRF